MPKRAKTFTLPALAASLERGSLVFYSLVLGAGVGVLGWGFEQVLGWGERFLLGLGNRPPNPPLGGGLPFVLEGPFLLAPLILMPAALLVLHLWAKPRGQADPLEVAVSLHNHGTPLEGARVHFTRALSNLLGLSVGLSTGRDGGLAALGSLAVTWLARAAELSRLELKSLRLAGIAAGLGIALQAPLAAAIFVLEMGFAKLELEATALLSSLVCSLSAYAVFSLLAGNESLFTFALEGFSPSPSLLLFGLLLGLVCGSLGLMFAEAISWAQKGALLLYQGKFALLVRLVAGLILGAIALFVPSSAGEGLGWFSLQLSGFFDVATLTQLVLFKTISVLLLVVIGYSSGLIIPTLVLGGSLGGLLGLLVNLVSPALAPSLPEASVLGACAFLAASYKTPLSSLLLGLGWANPALLPALGVAVGSAYMLSGNASVLASQQKDHSDQAAQNQHLEQHLINDISDDSGSSASTPELTHEVSELLHRISVPAHWLGQSVDTLLQSTMLESASEPNSVVFIAVLRGGEVQISTTHVLLEFGDQLILIASDSDFQDFEHLLNKINEISETSP